ncbi:MAG: hypothetical protein LQ351_003185, partial [Letrouitia transgressa]
ISHLKDAIEDNAENLDGYEELDPASQDKVRKAIEVGHVSDDDWKGDLEMNRPGKRGFRVKRPEKAKEETPRQTPDKVIAEDDTNRQALKDNKNAVKQEGLNSEEIAERPKFKKSKAVKREPAIKHEESEPVADSKEPASKVKKEKKAKVPKIKQEEVDATVDIPQPVEKKRKRAVGKTAELDKAEAADTINNEQLTKTTKKRSKKAHKDDVPNDADSFKAKRNPSRKARKAAVKEEEQSDAEADNAEKEPNEEEPVEPPSKKTRKKAKK